MEDNHNQDAEATALSREATNRRRSRFRISRAFLLVVAVSLGTFLILAGEHGHGLGSALVYRWNHRVYAVLSPKEKAILAVRKAYAGRILEWMKKNYPEETLTLYDLDRCFKSSAGCHEHGEEEPYYVSFTIEVHRKGPQAHEESYLPKTVTHPDFPKWTWRPGWYGTDYLRNWYLVKPEVLGSWKRRYLVRLLFYASAESGRVEFIDPYHDAADL